MLQERWRGPASTVIRLSVTAAMLVFVTDDSQTSGPRELGPARVGLDAEDGAAGGLEPTGCDPGAAADLKNVGPGTRGGDPRHQCIGVTRARLVGGGHLLFADLEPGPPTPATVNRFVTAFLAVWCTGDRAPGRHTD